MKYKDLKNLDAQEITKKRSELELELLKARAQSARGTLAKDPHQIHGIRRTLAQLNTLESAQRGAGIAPQTNVRATATKKTQAAARASRSSSPTKATKQHRTTNGGAPKS